MYLNVVCLNEHFSRFFLKLENMENKYSSCPEHGERQLNLYCSHCAKPVCVMCKATTHARHIADVKGSDALRKAVTARRKFLYKLLERKENTVVPVLRNLILSLSEDLAKLHADIDDGRRDYRRYLKKHGDKLALSDDDWNKDLRIRASKYYQLFDDKMDYLRIELSSKEASLRLLRRDVELLNDSDVLLRFGSLRTNLESIHEPNWLSERITVNLKLEMIPLYGANLSTADSQDKNCRMDFIHQLDKPVSFFRVFDTKIPVPKKILDDQRNRISISSYNEIFIAFNEYIFTYPLDNRRSSNPSNNIRCHQCITVRDIILDISCDALGNLFFLTETSVKYVTAKRTIKTCFRLQYSANTLCVTMGEIIIGSSDHGTIAKYTTRGDLIWESTHPDPKFDYTPRHIAANLKGDIFFSDERSTVTVLDNNGIWKGSLNTEIKTSASCAPLRPFGIACSTQRHLYVIDINSATNLHVFTEEGRYLQTAVFKHIRNAHTVHVDKTGDVWVGFMDGRVRIYRPQLVTNNGL